MTRIHPVDRHVGQRVRLARLAKGMSQTRLADSVGLTFQQIQKYEKGTNRVSASRLYQFSEILGVDIVYFFDGVGEHNVPLVEAAQEPLNMDLTRVDIAILQRLSEIDDNKIKRKILDLIGHLANPNAPDTAEAASAN